MCMRINCSVLVLDIAWDWHWELVCHNCMQVLLYFPDVCLMEDGSQPSTIANPNSHKHDIASSSPPSLKSNHPWPIRNLKDFQVLLKSSHTHQVRYFQRYAWWLIWYEWRSSLPWSNRWTLWLHDWRLIWLGVKIITPILQQVNFVSMMVPTYSRIRFLRMWSTRRCVCFIFSMQHNLLKFLD
jgi:hypothetical protein